MSADKLLRSLVVVVAGLMAAIAPISAASAHDQLKSTDPAANSTVATAPSTITLTFEEAPLAQGDFVTATSATGEIVALGAPVVNEDTVSATWPASASSGTYTVSWRVVADDGHPVDGTFAFTIAESPSPSASPSESTSSSASVASATSTPVTSDSSSTNNAVWWVVGALALAAGLVALIFSLRSKKTQ
jgi:methionine-rich copper-binding protein CopC